MLDSPFTAIIPVFKYIKEMYLSAGISEQRGVNGVLHLDFSIYKPGRSNKRKLSYYRKSPHANNSNQIHTWTDL